MHEEGVLVAGFVAGVGHLTRKKRSCPCVFDRYLAALMSRMAQLARQACVGFRQMVDGALTAQVFLERAVPGRHGACLVVEATQ
jgi:hypothetical protein